MAASGPQLRDIHLPQEPSWWPPAPGWWLLTIMAVCALVWIVWRLRRRARRLARDRRVLAELRSARDAWFEHRDDARLASELSAFLRRLGRAIRADSAGLNGVAWLAFLDRHDEGFSGDLGAALLQAPYQKNPKVDSDKLYSLVDAHVRRVLAQELAHV